MGARGQHLQRDDWRESYDLRWTARSARFVTYRLAQRCARTVQRISGPLRRLANLGDRWPSEPVRPAPAFSFAYVAGALALAALAVAVTLLLVPRAVPTGTAPVTAEPVVQAAPAPGPPPTSTNDVGAAIAARLGTIGGVVTAPIEGGLLVSFNEPLFRSASATIVRAQWGLVDRVVTELSAPPVRAISIRGYTDPRPLRRGSRWPGSGALARARAESVERRFDNALRGRVSISTSAPAAPFHDAVPTSRSRTVVLFVATRDGDPFATHGPDKR